MSSGAHEYWYDLAEAEEEERRRTAGVGLTAGERDRAALETLTEIKNSRHRSRQERERAA